MITYLSRSVDLSSVMDGYGVGIEVRTILVLCVGG